MPRIARTAQSGPPVYAPAAHRGGWASIIGGRLAVVTGERRVRVLDARNGQLRNRCTGFTPPTAVAGDNRGKLYASVWSIAFSFGAAGAGHVVPVNDNAFGPDPAGR